MKSITTKFVDMRKRLENSISQITADDRMPAIEVMSDSYLTNPIFKSIMENS